MLTRDERWPLILAEQVEGARKRPFAFGMHDCCLFAADVVLAMTGTDIAAGYRGKYKTERGALQLIAKGEGLSAMASKQLGKSMPALCAQRGDVVLISQGRYSLGICLGSMLVVPGKEGLVFLPIREAMCAWRV